MSDSDTIAAVATARGEAGVGIVRLSGGRSVAIAERMTGPLPPARRMALRRFRDQTGGLLDVGLVVHFPAPASFTGEDVVELHGHGGTVLTEMVLACAVELGARRAAPGEFSRRAFLNDRLDLTQAEAIVDLVASGSRRAARAALRTLDGAFSAAVDALVDELTELRQYVEAAIDFPEEEIDFLDDAALKARIAGVDRAFERLLRRVRRGRILNDGYTVVILGAPNAGKSSLMNRLSGIDAAIVTEIPGTTRDVLTERVALNGVPFVFVDTAGLRSTPDTIEAEGIRRARAAAASADHAILIVDAAADMRFDELEAELDADLTRTRVLNKIDLTGAAAGVREDEAVRISARTGAGLDALVEVLTEAAGAGAESDDDISARERHIEAIVAARRHFDDGRRVLETDRAGELMAEELRLAQQALGTITGAVSSDDLLGRIFASFCIGK